MKYVLTLVLTALSLLIYSGAAHALCFDTSMIIDKTIVGHCFGKDPEIIPIPVTAIFITWVMINVILGQILLMPKVHLGFKYLLFICGFPLSPFVVMWYFACKGIKRAFLALRSKMNENSPSKEEGIARDTSTGLSQASSSRKSEHNPASTIPTLHSQTIFIGNFEFNKLDQSLSFADKVTVLEPKCMQVLSYLIEQQPRIVSLEELHNNVWQNQIVTDTAVRRVIGKLRQAFADDDTKKPKYIKSIMKRGYQLIAKVKFQDAEK